MAVGGVLGAAGAARSGVVSRLARREHGDDRPASAAPDVAPPPRDGRGPTAKAPKPSRRAYRLGRGEPAGEGLRRIAIGRLDHAGDQLGGDGDPAEAVHEARKDLKKLRAVLRLLRSRIGKQLYRRENTELRDMGRLLATSRDAQVRLDTLDALVGSGAVEADAVAPLRAQLEQERDAIATPARGDPSAATRIAAAADRVRGWPVGGDGWDAIEPGLRRSYRRGGARMRDAIADPTVERLHEWRKRVKDLWYHLRILTPAWPAVIEALAEEAHLLSEQLGDDHDLAMLGTAARERAGAFADPGELDALLDAIDRRRSELQHAATSLGRRLYADEPGAFVSRAEVWWRAWRGPA